MVLLARVCLPVLIIFALCRESIQVKPSIKPDAGELILNEGDPLEIVCTSSEKIFFVYPFPSTDAVQLSDPEVRESEERGTYKYEFRRQQTSHGDTGWYGCTNHPLEVTIESYNDTSIAWLYVYVQSNESLFVDHDVITTLREIVGGTVIIPCRPTSPNLTVTLLKDDSEEFMEDHSDRVTFDRRIGFFIAYVTVTDSGYFKCLIKQGTPDEQEVNYHLNVLRKHSLTEPKIIEDTLRHVTRGQTLHVNCTIDVAAEMDYALNWKTPQQSPRITTVRYSTIFGRNNRRATSELVIKNVMDEDEGEYECVITTYQNSKSAKKYIQVHDPDIKFIILTSDDRDRHYQARYGSKVQWVVYVHAYPQPILRWVNPKGEDIQDNWKDPERTKYAVNTTPSQTILRINRLHVDDMGIYSLQATNEDTISTLNFTLDVMARPIPLLTDIQSYYAPNETASFQCHIAAFPTPNITWTFKKCPNYPTYENSTVVNLSNTTEEGKMTSFRSIVLMTIEMSGHVTCTACNSLGCDSVTENIFVSDGDGGFAVINPPHPITEGDNIELVCAASVYNYTLVSWKNDDTSPILVDDRVKVIHSKTKFTYRSILKINNVQKEDAKSYICAAENTDGMIEQLDYELIVHEARAPYFKTTNMNNSEVIIDLNADGHKLVVLWCFADGMPKPNITWFKDNKILNASERHRFSHEGQELRLRYLLEPDSGRYTCRVENRIGKVEVYEQITVKGKELPKGLIILIVVLVVIVIILIVYFTIKVRREKVMRKELMEAGLMHFEEGALECLNPDLTVDDQAELLPYDKKWEFPRERLKLGKQLGSGAFGVVMKAEAQGICEDEAVTTVAVKMVRRTTDPTYVRALASELKIMVHLGKHLNVVNLLGACTKNIAKRELLVIVEYCRFGNLHNYLLRHRADFINQIDPVTGKFDPTIGIELLARANSIESNNRIKYAALSFSRSLSGNSGMDSAHYCQGTVTDSQGVSMSPDGCVLSNNSIQPGWRSNYRGDYKDHNLKPICTQDLLSWAFQVARGMEYLSQRRVLHGDLAARNILLAENNIVKICDFGLAKTMYKDDNYKKKGDGPLPIKWMAIESIRDRVFSTQSDIWSFGIVLWEFFTLAETPYPGMEAKNQYQQLIEGYRMEQPEYATFEVYDIMLKCWKAKPTLRPSFTELVDSIGDLLEESVRAHYVSLNAPYMDMNTMILEGGKDDYLTMMSRPDHTALSSPTHDYVNSPICGNPSDPAYLCMSPTEGRDESGIFSPRPTQEKTHFEFPSPTSDSEDAIELSPMLKKQNEEEDPYLKPINVHERRAEFARQRQALKNHPFDIDQNRDSGYCNAPRNLPLIDLNGKSDRRAEEFEEEDKVDSGRKRKEYTPSIIRTQDNYVNMPKQKSDMLRDMPDSFSNPSYVMMGNRETNQTKV